MRKAICSCGQLSIAVSGEPELVFICHCRECQKATGAPFGVSTYWPQTAIADIRGTSRSYTRQGDAGRLLTNHFCPTCGGRLFWYAEYFPESVGVALGNFENPDLPLPQDEFWTLRKHPWVSFTCPVVPHAADD